MLFKNVSWLTKYKRKEYSINNATKNINIPINTLQKYFKKSSHENKKALSPFYNNIKIKFYN